MKTRLRVLYSALLCVLAAALFGGYALAEEGLDAFSSSAAMNERTFSDVAPADWYYTGVRSAYDMTIMDGVGGGRFDPEGTVSWAQAITIASRVHARYSGTTIPESADAAAPWHARYTAYARANGLLPKNIPGDAALDETPAEREVIAYLFSAVVSEGDLAKVSERKIPDLDKAGAEFQKAVETLYRAGVFTGVDEAGSFAPKALATRAEIATITARLVRPAERVHYDPDYPEGIIGQEGNLLNYGIVTRDDSFVYLSNKMETKNGRSTEILRLDPKNPEKIECIYCSEDKVTYNILGLQIHDGFLYFHDTERATGASRAYNGIKKLDLKTLVVTTVCEPSEASISAITVYRGEVYALSDKSLMKVSNKRLTKLYTEDSKYGTRVHGLLLPFDGKLYFSEQYGNLLYSYDIVSKKTELVLKNIRECLPLSGKLYYILYEGDMNEVYAASLADLSHPKLLATLPKDVGTNYAGVGYDGKRTYWIGSESRQLYYVDPATGAWGLAAVMPHISTENPIFVAGNLICGSPEISAGNLSKEYRAVLGIDSNAPEQTWLGCITGQSMMVDGKNVLPAAEGSALTIDEKAGEQDGMSFRTTGLYRSRGGVLVVEAKATNENKDVSLRINSVRVTVKGENGAVIADAVIDMGGILRPGRDPELSFILCGKDILLPEADFSSIETVECEYETETLTA